MKKLIKTGENIGVAIQVQGIKVEVIPHPRFKGLWQFKVGDETWMASDFAFVGGNTTAQKCWMKV